MVNLYRSKKIWKMAARRQNCDGPIAKNFSQDMFLYVPNCMLLSKSEQFLTNLPSCMIGSWAPCNHQKLPYSAGEGVQYDWFVSVKSAEICHHCCTTTADSTGVVVCCATTAVPPLLCHQCCATSAVPPLLYHYCCCATSAAQNVKRHKNSA